MEYYSAIKKKEEKKKEIFPFATAWVDPEGIVLESLPCSES